MNTTSFLSCFILNSSFTTLHSVILSVWTILQQVIPVLLLNWIIFLFNHLLTPWVYVLSWSYIIEQYTSTIKLWVWHIKHLTALLNEKYRLPVGDIVWETGRAGFPLSFSWESDIHTQFWKTKKGCHLLKGSHSYWIY